VPLHGSGPWPMDHRAAKPLGVPTPAVRARIERFAEVHAQEPGPGGRAVVVEPGETWHRLGKSPASSGSGRLGIVPRGGSSPGSWAAGRDRATRGRLLGRLERWGVRLDGADGWAAHAELIPRGPRHVGEEETHGIARGPTRVSGPGSPASGAAPACAPRPCARSRPRSRAPPASAATARASIAGPC
jgi:hypothetical protein